MITTAMSENILAVQQRMEERYTSGQLPWDAEEPPPEVMAIVAELRPGRALDLGCGYGRSSIYMAQHGWQVDGVDFVAQAIATAQERARAKEVGDQVNFHQSSVTQLDFLTTPYDLAIDVGCMHALEGDDRLAYRDEVKRLVQSGGIYLLYARLREPEQDGGPRGIEETAVYELFDDGFTLEKMERGETKVEDQPIWASGWFWFRRQ